LGYDNAHIPPLRKSPKRKSVQPLAFDHIHRRDRVRSYSFRTPEDLLKDFWADVESILGEEGVQ
jgi:hypothetical protein